MPNIFDFFVKAIDLKTKEPNRSLGKPKVCYFGEGSLLILVIERGHEPLFEGDDYYVVQAVDDNPIYREVFSLEDYEKALEAFNIRKDSYRPDLSSEFLKYVGPKNYIFISRGVSAKLELEEAKLKFPPTK